MTTTKQSPNTNTQSPSKTTQPPGKTLTPQELKKLAKKLAAREKFQRENPLFFTHLNNAQRQFMDATVDGGLPRRLLFVGCNKSGKSTVGVLRGICLALGEHPFLPEDHPLRYLKDWPTPNVGLVCGEQLSQAIDKNLCPKYLEWIPKICQLKAKRNPQGVIVRIILQKDLRGKPLNSQIFFRSWDMTPDSFEGIDQKWLHWDEPPKYPHYVAAERGLVATEGISYMTFTSLKEPWIKDFANDSVDYGGKDKNVRVVESGSIYDNLKENGGFLTRDAVDEFVKIVPKEEYPARIMGEWMQSGGLIYSSFKDQSPWVIPNFEMPSHWTVVEAMDPHDAKPTKWISAAISPYDISIDDEMVNRIFILDYLSLSSDMTIIDMVREIKRRRIDLGYGERSLYSLVLDAKYGKKRVVSLDGKEPVNWESKLVDAGIGYVELSHSKPGDVELGHKIVRAYLRPQYFKMAEKDVPGVVFLERCRGMDGPIEGMLKYRYKLQTHQPDEECKDIMDCLRYVCMAKPVYIERYGRGRGDKFVPRDERVGR